VRASITALTGTQRGRSFTLADAPLVLGRNPDCDVVLGSASASRRHAEIRAIPAGLLLTDLGSANGTFVNGRRLAAAHLLRPGDVVQIGDESFRFDQEAPAVSAPAVPTHSPVARASRLPNWVLALALIGLVLVAGCIGGAVMVTRAVLPSPEGTNATSLPTTAPAATRAPRPTTAPSADRARWTVLVYLDGDNNLEADAIGDLNEMELVGSNDDVRIVVQLDRIRSASREDDKSNGDWTTTKRFLVERDTDPVELGSRELDDLGELNMGDPQTLVDFAVWGMTEYPADRYALVLWDHGSSWAGIAFDDTDGEDGITMPELDAALRTIQAQTGVARLDLIGFDACLMAQIDVLQTVAPYARTMVASAELEPNDGWAWDLWLRALADDPAQDGPALARNIVDSYRVFYEGGDDDTVTLSAFDLTEAERLIRDFDRLANSMTANIESAYPALAAARSYTEAYNPPRPEEFSAVDLGHFAVLVQERGAPSTVADAARTLATTIEATRIAAWSGGFHTNHSGLSVFFPQLPELLPPFYSDASPTPRETGWDEFLAAFHSAGARQVSTPQIGELIVSSASVGVNTPLTLQSSVTGDGIAEIFFFVGVPNADENSVQLTAIEYVYPSGGLASDASPAWPSQNDISVGWDGTQWGLTNGSDTILVLLGPVKYGAALYGIEGVYAVQGTGAQIDAGMLVRLEQDQALLQAIYGFPKASKQEAQPYEIAPSAGDRFTALLRTYTVRGEQLVPGREQGQTLTIGADALQLTRLPAPSGDYVAGLLVRDIAGRFSYAYRAITVDN
jgi:hypothetical protein